ncbi:MAG: hypothetical protein SPL50_01185 [Alloprevotella sp.]|nr:hypothetical protein [Alloprevotella sp.]
MKHRSAMTLNNVTGDRPATATGAATADTCRFWTRATATSTE